MNCATITQLILVIGIYLVILIKFGIKIKMDLMEDDLKESIMKKTDKEILLELLKRANLEWDEWNEFMMTWDDGYIEAIFDKEGNLRDIRSRAEG
jgi:hypothetical protein